MLHFTHVTPVSIAMWLGLSYFAYKQSLLHLACDSITIFVGDNIFHETRFFSGTYLIQEETINNRAGETDRIKNAS